MLPLGLFREPWFCAAQVGAFGISASLVNDLFHRAGVAAGVAALGALVPEGAGLGRVPAGLRDGLHDALWAGAALAVTAGALSAVLLRERRAARAGVPARSPPRRRGRTDR